MSPASIQRLHRCLQAHPGVEARLGPTDLVLLGAAVRPRLAVWRPGGLAPTIVVEVDPAPRSLALYAAAGVPEVWLVEPRLARIEVVRLDAETRWYGRPATFLRGMRLDSRELPGFRVRMDDLFS